MKICILTSTNVKRIAHYTSPVGDILLTMLKGGDYAYLGVPLAVYEQMCAAESAGKFLNDEIKPKYQYRQMLDVERHQMLTGEPSAPPSVASKTPQVFGSTPGAVVRSEFDRHALHGLPHEAMADLIFPHANNWPNVVDVKLLDPKVELRYAKPGDAAFDLMAVKVTHPTMDIPMDFPVTVEPGKHVLIGTGISMRLGPGLAGLVLPRSGSAKKQRIGVVNAPGLIDGKYTGEIGVLFENRGDKSVKIKQYDRIAQYMITPVVTPIFRLVNELEQTERGSAGFGSTGTEKDVV